MKCMGRIGFRFEFLMRLCELVCVCVLASDARELSAMYVQPSRAFTLGRDAHKGLFNSL